MSEEVANATASEGIVSHDVLLDCIRKVSGKDNVEIVDDLVIVPVTRRVEGFTSTVYRLKVTYRVEGKVVVQTKSLLLKRLPESAVQSEIVRSGGLFQREVFFFQKAFPFMKGIGGRRLNLPVPDCYHAFSDGQNDLIVMEDLSEEGLRSPNHTHLLNGLDLDHCMLTLKKLGQLHGFSYAAERTMTRRSGGWLGMEPALEKDLLFYETSEGDQRGPSHAYGMLLGSINTAVDLAGEVDQRAADSASSGELAGILEGAWSMACKLVERDPKDHNVLCHGDCWMNNVLYRYDKVAGKEKLVDAKFLDFQLSRYAHPCLDIVYFMHLSTRRSFRKKYMNELLLAYYNSLVDTLGVLGKGSPPITLRELRHDISIKFKPFGIIMAAILKPILSLDPEFIFAKTENGAEELIKVDHYQLIKDCYESVPEYKAALIEVLEELFELMLHSGAQ